MKRTEKKRDDGHTHYSLWSNIRFFFQYLFQYKKICAIMLPVFILLTLFKNMFLVLIPSVAVGSIEQGQSLEQFLVQVGGVVLLYGIIACSQSMAEAEYNGNALVTRVSGNVARLVEKCLSMDYVNRESYKNQKIFQGANAALCGNMTGVEMIYRQAPLVILNLVGLFIYGSAILTVDMRILLVLFLMFGFNLFFNARARSYLEQGMEENNEINQKKDYLSNRAYNLECGKEARLFRMERWFGDLAEKCAEDGTRWQKGVEKRFYLPVASDTIFIALRDGLAYVLLIHDVLSGKISVAMFVLLTGIVTEFSTWMFGLVNAFTALKKASLEADYYRSALELEDSFLHEGGKGVPGPEEYPLDIVLEDVSFSYECGQEGETERKEVLSHINLHIHPGEKIALVGNNGAGKTTLVKLLCGFYHPTGGRILVNGTDVEEYNIEEYFKLLGVVFQDVDVPAFTVQAVVTGRAREDSDMERFWRAVERAGLKEKILSLEKKENTYLTQVFDEEGIRLSGGEVQKLMLARCIYKDAPIMILDEPTAALDPIAESEMYGQYNEMTEGKSSIFISHRLASTRFCDRILFLENGRIAEEGTHQELMARQGRYAKIYQIQSHYYKQDGGAEGTVDMEAAYE